MGDAEAHGRELGRKLGTEIHRARLAAGLSQRAVARAAQVTQPRVSHLERGVAQGRALAELSRVARAVGLKLTVACYPVGDALRDAPQRGLIEGLMSRCSPNARWRTEVPMPIPGDLRAVDAVVTVGYVRVAVEAWTRLDDLQAQVRSAQLKRRDLGAERLLMLVADTPHNRRALRAAEPTIAASFPLGTRGVLAALAAARDPGADGIVLLRIPKLDTSRISVVEGKRAPSIPDTSTA